MAKLDFIKQVYRGAATDIDGGGGMPRLRNVTGEELINLRKNKMVAYRHWKAWVTSLFVVVELTNYQDFNCESEM